MVKAEDLDPIDEKTVEVHSGNPVTSSYRCD